MATARPFVLYQAPRSTLTSTEEGVAPFVRKLLESSMGDIWPGFDVNAIVGVEVSHTTFFSDDERTSANATGRALGREQFNVAVGNVTFRDAWVLWSSLSVVAIPSDREQCPTFGFAVICGESCTPYIWRPSNFQLASLGVTECALESLASAPYDATLLRGCFRTALPIAAYFPHTGTAEGRRKRLRDDTVRAGVSMGAEKWMPARVRADFALASYPSSYSSLCAELQLWRWNDWKTSDAGPPTWLAGVGTMRGVAVDMRNAVDQAFFWTAHQAAQIVDQLSGQVEERSSSPTQLHGMPKQGLPNHLAAAYSRFDARAILGSQSIADYSMLELFLHHRELPHQVLEPSAGRTQLVPVCKLLASEDLHGLRAPTRIASSSLWLQTQSEQEPDSDDDEVNWGDQWNCKPAVACWVAGDKAASHVFPDLRGTRRGPGGTQGKEGLQLAQDRSQTSRNADPST